MNVIPDDLRAHAGKEEDAGTIDYVVPGAGGRHGPAPVLHQRPVEEAEAHRPGVV